MRLGRDSTRGDADRITQTPPLPVAALRPPLPRSQEYDAAGMETVTRIVRNGPSRHPRFRSLVRAGTYGRRIIFIGLAVVLTMQIPASAGNMTELDGDDAPIFVQTISITGMPTLLQLGRISLPESRPRGRSPTKSLTS